LHLAVCYDQKEFVKTLLSDASVNISPIDRFGNLSLDDAIREGHKEMEQLLLAEIAAGPAASSDSIVHSSVQSI